MTATVRVDGYRPLVAAPWRPLVWAVLVACVLAFVSLAVAVHHTSSPTAFDSEVATGLARHTGGTARRLLLALTEPALTVGVIVAVTLVALLLRRWNVAILAPLAQLAAVVSSSVVLKPVVDRLHGQAGFPAAGGLNAQLAFPSGHETALTAAVVVGVLLLARRPIAPRTGLLVGTLAVLWVVLGAAGLVVNDYHYASDTVGGFLVALAVTLGSALAVDATVPRVAARRRRPQPAAPAQLT